MSNKDRELEHILDRLAVRMYDEGQLDKPSLMGRQVAMVNIRDAKEAILKWRDTYSHQRELEAEIRGFDTAYDSHDYDRLREYRAGLQSNLVGNINGINIETDDRLEDGEYYVKQSQEREQSDDQS